ncbi:MAG: hypothetical protein ABIS35_15370 [Terracoccus sp.]
MTAGTLTAPREEATPRRPPRRRWPAVVVIALVLLAGLGFGVKVATGHPDDVRDNTQLVDVQGMADRAGIRITLLGLVAQGGMIQFRYQVVDPDKASNLLDDPALRPILVVEDTGETIVLSSRPHKHGSDVNLGGTYFFMLPNAHDAVHDGTKLTVVIGDARIEHLVAQQ